MKTTDHTQTPEETPPRSYGYCAWHKGFAEGVRLIQAIEQPSSGGGANLFACAPCRHIHRLVPYADRP